MIHSSFSPFFIQSTLEGTLYAGTSIHATDICVDSRLVKEGSCFFALPGKRCDGHDFIENVIQKGAVGLVIESSHIQRYLSLPAELQEKSWCITVENTGQALIHLARTWRSFFSIPFIGVTGTVGKTTTKEMIGKILTHAGHNPLITQNSMNGLIGLPLTLLRLRPEHTIAVCEAGISLKGEMDILAQILKPTIGVLTYAGQGHLQGLGSVEDVFNEKRKLFSYFGEHHTAIINGNQELIYSHSYSHPVITFGLTEKSDICIENLHFVPDGIQASLSIHDRAYQVTFPTLHKGTISNMLASIAAVQPLGIADEHALSILQTFKPLAGRFRNVTYARYKACLIDDTYNANPESMREGIAAFDRLSWERKKVLVLGDMFELGLKTEELHEKLAHFITQASTIETVILIGSSTQATREHLPSSLSTYHVAAWPEALRYVEQAIEEGSAVMIKGGRSMNLDKIVDYIQERYH